MALETLALELVLRQSRLVVSRIGIRVVAAGGQLLSMVVPVIYSGRVLLSADELRWVLSTHQEFCRLLSARKFGGKSPVEPSMVVWSEAWPPSIVLAALHHCILQLLLLLNSPIIITLCSFPVFLIPCFLGSRFNRPKHFLVILHSLHKTMEPIVFQVHLFLLPIKVDVTKRRQLILHVLFAAERPLLVRQELILLLL